MSWIVPPDEEADVHISRYGVIGDFGLPEVLIRSAQNQKCYLGI